MMKAMKKADNKPSSLEEVEDVCWTHFPLLFLFYDFFLLYFLTFLNFSIFLQKNKKARYLIIKSDK